LGINNIDYQNKEITIRFNDIVLNSCEGSIPIGEETVSLSWKYDKNKIVYSLSVPKGYRVKIENHSSREIIKHQINKYETVM
jgi:hypothetical protein